MYYVIRNKPKKQKDVIKILFSAKVKIGKQFLRKNLI